MPAMIRAKVFVNGTGMMRKLWRDICRLIVGIAIAFNGWCAADSLAQSYPGKGMRLIVGFATGGGTDTAARLLAQKLSAPEYLGHPVALENRIGASGAIASEMVAKAPADGYALLMLATADTIQPALGIKLPYDVERDFAPISLVGATPFALVVHQSLPVRNVRQLRALARARPGELNYGSSGNGSPTHLMTELFNSMARTRIIQVPYKGSGQIIVAVTSGEIPLTFVSSPGPKPLLDSGKITALALSSAKRSSLFPTIPTIDESALPGYDITGSWFGAVAPANVPKNIIAWLSSTIVRALNTPDMKESLNRQGIEPQPTTPEQLATFIHNDIAQNTKLAKAIGIQPE